MQQHTLLIASADQEQRDYLATQLVADGHTVYDTDTAAGAIAKLSTQAIDVMLLGALEPPPTAARCCARSTPASTGASTPTSPSSRSAPTTRALRGTGWLSAQRRPSV
jgi:CheY-like chemotaxis protein